MERHIVFGRSESIKADEIMDRLDVYSGDSESGKSWFELHFKTSYLEDGNSEVYGADDYDLNDLDLLRKLFPFELPEKVIPFLMLGEPACVFFFVDTKAPVNQKIDGIELRGPIEIDRFEYE